MEKSDSLVEEDDLPNNSATSVLWQLIEVVQASADVIISIDDQERISFVNAAVENLFGYSPQELTGQSLSILIPPTYRSGHSRHVESFKTTDMPARMMAQRRPVFGIKKDGQMVPLEISILRHNKAGAFRLSAIIRDISERVSHKNQITENDRRYLAMLESRKRPTALLTPTGRIIDLNAVALADCSLADGALDKADIVGRNIWEAPWWHGEERRNILRDMIDGIEAGASQTFVMERPRPDGSLQKVELSLRAMSPEGRTMDFIVAEWQDLQKAASPSDGAQKSKMRLDLLQRAARIGSWEWALATEELYWSEETYRIFGFSPESDKPSYTAALDRIHPDDRTAVQNAIANAISGADGFSIFYRLVLPDGGEKLVQHSGRLLRSNDGKPLQILATVQDITETSLREKELMDALDRLKETGLAKARFLANLSHELRTPLNIIIGFSEFIQNSAQDIEPEKIDEYARYIAGGGHRLLALVNDIILALRLDARMVQLQDEESRIAKVIEDVLQQQKEAAEKKFVTFRVAVPDHLYVLADELLLFRALSSVINNAVKFGQDGGQVSISTAIDKTGLQIIVEDDGSGMKDDRLDDAFEPFAQLDGDLNRRYEGIGLGLTIVRGVLKLHEGGVAVRKSALGGLRVELTFPPKRILAR